MKTLNDTLAKHTNTINLASIMLALLVFLSQFPLNISSYTESRMNIDQHYSDMIPMFSFKVVNPQGAVKMFPIKQDFIFEFANVMWPSELQNQVSNPPVENRDSNFYLAPLNVFLSQSHYLDTLEANQRPYKVRIPVVLRIAYNRSGQLCRVNNVYLVNYLIDPDPAKKLNYNTVEVQSLNYLKTVKSDDLPVIQEELNNQYSILRVDKNIAHPLI